MQGRVEAKLSGCTSYGEIPRGTHSAEQDSSPLTNIPNRLSPCQGMMRGLDWGPIFRVRCDLTKQSR